MSLLKNSIPLIFFTTLILMGCKKVEDPEPLITFSTWTVEGPGTTVVTDSVFSDNKSVQFTYNRTRTNFNEESWVFKAKSERDEPIKLNYHWKGFHSFFAVTTTLKMEDELGVKVVDNIQPGGVGGPNNCCGGVSDGFEFSGTVTVDPKNGEYVFFTLSGDNQDGNNVLRGTFTLTIAE